MTKIILPAKIYDAQFADASISTDKFVALLMPGYDIVEIVRDFSGVQRIDTETDEMPPKIFEGYTVFDSLFTLDSGIQIILRKEA